MIAATERSCLHMFPIRVTGRPNRAAQGVPQVTETAAEAGSRSLHTLRTNPRSSGRRSNPPSSAPCLRTSSTRTSVRSSGHTKSTATRSFGSCSWRLSDCCSPSGKRRRPGARPDPKVTTRRVRRRRRPGCGGRLDQAAGTDRAAQRPYVPKVSAAETGCDGIIPDPPLEDTGRTQRVVAETVLGDGLRTRCRSLLN